MQEFAELQQLDQKPVNRIPSIHLVLAFGAFLLIGLNDATLGVLIPSMRTFYRVDTATIAWFFFLITLGYLTATLNNGLLIERLGERRFLLLGLGIFLLGMVLGSLRPPFGLFLGVCTIFGFGVGMIDAGLNVYVAAKPGNAVVLNYLHAFYGFGALIAPLVASGVLALQQGWQVVYLIWGLLAIGMLLGFWLSFRPQVELVREKGSARPSLLSSTVRLRAVWLAAFFLLFYVGTEVSLGSWSYSFLTVARMGPVLISAWVVSGYWAGLTLGRLTLAHFLLKRLGIRRFIMLCLIGTALGLLMTWVLPGFWGAVPGLCLIGFSLGPLFPTIISLMPQLVVKSLLPTSIGFITCLGSAGGALLPWLAGNAIQRIGFWSLLPFALVQILLMVVFWLFLNRVPTRTISSL